MTDPKTISLQEHTAIHDAIESSGHTGECGGNLACAGYGTFTSCDVAGDISNGTYESEGEKEHPGHQD